jgi:hypothetical protein
VLFAPKIAIEPGMIQFVRRSVMIFASVIGPTKPILVWFWVMSLSGWFGSNENDKSVPVKYWVSGR